MAKTLTNDEDRAALEKRVASLTPDRPAVWGTMSAHQAICHLIDSMKLPLGEKDVAPLKMKAPIFLMKFVALTAPLPWPKGLDTAPEMKQGAGGTPPGEFEQDRKALLDAVGRFVAQSPGAERPSHPAFGQLTAAQWDRWAWRHIDHHLRQFGV